MVRTVAAAVVVVVVDVESCSLAARVDLARSVVVVFVAAVREVRSVIERRLTVGLVAELVNEG